MFKISLKKKFVLLLRPRACANGGRREGYWSGFPTVFVLLSLSPEAKVQFEPGAHSQVSLVLFEGYPPAQRAAGSSSTDPGRAGEMGGQGQPPPREFSKGETKAQGEERRDPWPVFSGKALNCFSLCRQKASRPAHIQPFPGGRMEGKGQLPPGLVPSSPLSPQPPETDLVPWLPEKSRSRSP